MLCSRADATGSAGALELIQLQVSPWSLRVGAPWKPSLLSTSGSQTQLCPAANLQSMRLDTEQARWALKYHGIPYTASSYTPILGVRHATTPASVHHSRGVLLSSWAASCHMQEPWLRLKAGRLLSMQRVTAPILITERDGAHLFGCGAVLAPGITHAEACGHRWLLPAGTLYESFDIAQWADDHSLRGDGARLLPAHQLMDIRRCSPPPFAAALKSHCHSILSEI